MKRYAFLCGSAPEGKIQKKINKMHDFLTSEQGGSWQENQIIIFPNGIDEKLFEYVLNNLRMSKIEAVFFYICTVTPVGEKEETVWLGGNEIQKNLFESLSASYVVYDCCRDFKK